MPDNEITDEEIGRFAMTSIDRVLTIAGRIADAYVRRVDREDDEGMLPGECEPTTQPPAGTPTGPANADGSFDEPVQRTVWMSPSDPRDGVAYRLAHAADGSLALIDASEIVAHFQGGAVDVIASPSAPTPPSA